MKILKKYLNKILQLFGYSISKVKEITTLEYFLIAHNYYIGRKFLNYEISDFEEYIKNNFQKSNSSLLQDLFALWVNKNIKNGYFVEFGAGNGIDFSNTLILELEGWTGLLIEPSSNFISLSNNRKSSVLNYAVTDRSNEKISFYEASDKNFSSFSPSKNSKRTTVNTITLSDALALVKAPNYINFISIDVEGAELQSILGMDFSKYFVKCLVIEHNNNEENRKKIYNYLTDRKFTRVFTNQTMYEDWYVNNE
jgi:FkbM family methyltransferase